MGWGGRGEKALWGKPTSCGQSSGEGTPTTLKYHQYNNLLKHKLFQHYISFSLNSTYSKILPNWSTSEFPRKRGLEKEKKLQLIARLIL